MIVNRNRYSSLSLPVWPLIDLFSWTSPILKFDRDLVIYHFIFLTSFSSQKYCYECQNYKLYVSRIFYYVEIRHLYFGCYIFTPIF